MRIPEDFQRFLNNNKNKERLFELIEETYINHKGIFNSRKTFLARGNTSKFISSDSVEDLHSLNNEEPDTKLVSLLRHAIENESNLTDAVFVVRLPSGDIDIPVIMLSSNLSGNIMIDNSSNYCKTLLIDRCDLTLEQRNSEFILSVAMTKMLEGCTKAHAGIL